MGLAYAACVVAPAEIQPSQKAAVAEHLLLQKGHSSGIPGPFPKDLRTATITIASCKPERRSDPGATVTPRSTLYTAGTLRRAHSHQGMAQIK